MKGPKTLIRITGLLSICATTSVFAVCSLPNGWYLEGNIGGTTFSGQSYPSGISNSTSGKAWNVNGGYKFSPFVGGEVGYTRYAPTRITDPSLAPGTLAQVQHVTIDVAAKLMYPIQNTGVEPFAKLGLGNVHSQVNHIQPPLQGYPLNGNQNKTGLYWGAGVAYYFTPNFAANLQYAQAKGNSSTGTPSAYTAGLSFLFG